ncbi:MAG: hypothetical protein ACTHMV_00945 [Chitinophagaceae bacterium]
MKLIFCFLISILFFSCQQSSNDHNIYGKWSLRFKSGPMAEVRFRNNGTHDYYVGGKLFSSGKSLFKNDTLRSYDPICGGNAEYYGTYTIDFLSGDSIRFKAVEDSCEPRRLDMDGAVLHRIKK